MTIKTKPSHGPICPNHGVRLEDCGFPMPAKGEGTCPVSGARFAFEIDLDEQKMKEVKDKFGNIAKEPVWKLTGEE